MKKFVCALMITTLLIGSVTAFAASCTECDFTGTFGRVTTTKPKDSCHYYKIVTYYCPDCHAEQGEDKTLITSHDWHVDIIDGREAKVCYKCDEVIFL